MRPSFVGALLGASLVIGAFVARSASEPAYGPPIDLPARHGSSDSITHCVTVVEGGVVTHTVFDPRHRVLAVYHEDRASGELTLKSVRNITWDLQMIEFNSGKPLPQDIRSGLAP